MSAGTGVAAGIITFVAAMGLAVAAALPPQLDELDTVVITGSQPAPGLWKVSKGNHVLWVLANFASPPGGTGGMTWQKVEARIAESQEVISPGYSSTDIDWGLLAHVKFTKAVMQAARSSDRQPVAPDPKRDMTALPDSKTLKDVLPTDTYGKWLMLRSQYLSEDDDVEKHLPAIALEKLRAAANKAVFLAAFPGNGQRASVTGAVYKAAGKHKVRIRQLPGVDRTVNVDGPQNLLTSATNIALPDVECFARGVGRLDSTEIERWKAVTDAWNVGNLEKLRNLFRGGVWQPYNSCFDVMTAETFALGFTGLGLGDSLDAANVKKLAGDISRNREQAEAKVQKDWIAAARKAIARNKSTFTVAPMNEIFLPDGFIEKMRALGYTIEDPL